MAEETLTFSTLSAIHTSLPSRPPFLERSMALDTPPSSPLVNFLKKHDPGLYGKVCEVRTLVKQWLTYIPQTFGHYTSHTIDHSDEIVFQASKLIFHENKRPPSIRLGPVAAYILITSAYLHDAGMVTPESEKEKILTSKEWLQWVTEGGGLARWRELQLLRKAAGPSEAAKHFAVDRATRILIAEFIRRQHHKRADDLVRSRAIELGRIDIGDHILCSAIAKVCLAHGLDHAEIEDDNSFPEATDIQGEQINLRLLATLLRLGDLLDMRTDRACPLLLQAACPLPADSIAHWTQHHCITHRLTTPTQIDVRAECNTHDEHRVLSDWCSWIVREVDRIPRRLPKTQWVPPRASIEGTDATISIRPSATAAYIPANWTFELDADLVFQRLIADVYESPDVFIRELIQNALDANRCKMYMDLQRDGSELPQYPNEASEEILERYPIHVALREEMLRNELSGEDEVAHVLTIEDPGLGMDKEVIQRYLLQVGRSYYTTPDFLRNFPFHPTSRFGIGFLSVFAVSEHVTIETFKPSSKSQDGPLQLSLTGPRNYILLQKGVRSLPGTSIEVRLRNALAKPLEETLRQWCVFVEFPIVVDDYGLKTTIRRLDLDSVERDWTLEGQNRILRLSRRVHPVKLPGVTGGIVNDWQSDQGQEFLSCYGGAARDLPVDDIEAIIAHHGIVTYRGHVESAHITPIVDSRRPSPLPLSREYRSPIVDEEVLHEIGKMVGNYLGSDTNVMDGLKWRRIHDLFLNAQARKLALWNTRADFVPIWIGGTLHSRSVPAIAQEPTIFLAHNCGIGYVDEELLDESDISSLLPDQTILLSASFAEMENMIGSAPSALLHSLQTPSVSWLDHKYLVAEFRVSEASMPTSARRPFEIDRPDIPFDVMSFGHHIVVNVSMPFGKWFSFINAYMQQTHQKRPAVGRSAWEKVYFNVTYMARRQYRDKPLETVREIWNKGPHLSAEHRWPESMPTYWKPPAALKRYVP